MRLTWYGHSCFLVETDSGSIVFDPYAPGSIPGLRLPPIEADAVVCSHYHNDHGYSDAVTLSGREPGFTLRRFPSFHDDRQGALRGENLLSLLDAEGLKLLHLGDLGHQLSKEIVSAIGRVDVLLIPVGGYYTIDAATAAETVEALKPGIVVPMHYSGDGFGFSEIAPVSGFAALCKNPHYCLSNVLEISGIGGEPVTEILKCPVYQG